MRVAVVGSGIAGCAAAYALGGVADLTVYERESRLGGHAHTVGIDYDGKPLDVDIGFIVYNELNYPNLKALFHALDVETEPTRMSFSVSLDDGRLEWCGRSDRPLSGLFAQRRNALSPRFWQMLRELLRFRHQSLADLRQDRVGDDSLGEYIARHGFSRRFCDAVLVPMGAAIWSSAPNDILAFQARSFLTFFDNHRLLQRRRPLWRTVAGGSRRYVEKLAVPFRGHARLGAAVVGIRRANGRVEIVEADGQRDSFDHVIVATHAPQALALLADADEHERSVLAAFRTTRNDAYLHRDVRCMPRHAAAWAAWNVRLQSGLTEQAVGVTYWMNRLQNIDPARPLFVSLNPTEPPPPECTFFRHQFAHPLYDRASDMARKRLPSLQGRGGVWFCGAWTGYGFHEDGLVSGLEVAEALGGSVPWRRSMGDRQRRAAE